MLNLHCVCVQFSASKFNFCFLFHIMNGSWSVCVRLFISSGGNSSISQGIESVVSSNTIVRYNLSGGTVRSKWRCWQPYIRCSSSFPPQHTGKYVCLVQTILCSFSFFLWLVLFFICLISGTSSCSGHSNSWPVQFCVIHFFSLLNIRAFVLLCIPFTANDCISLWYQ